jgi:hypothetical protein
MRVILASQSNGSSNCSSSGGLRLNPFLSCFVSQAFALYALKGDIGTVRVIEAKFDAGVLPEIKFSQVPVKMLAIDVLINANDAALKHAKKSFQRVRMHVTARPLKFVVIDGFMFGEAAEFEILPHVGNEPAFLIHKRPQMPSNATVIERDGADVAAALNETENLGVMQAAAEAFRAPRLAGPFRFRPPRPSFLRRQSGLPSRGPSQA